jgi:hypothetical protein
VWCQQESSNLQGMHQDFSEVSQLLFRLQFGAALGAVLSRQAVSSFRLPQCLFACLPPLGLFALLQSSFLQLHLPSVHAIELSCTS